MTRIVLKDVSKRFETRTLTVDAVRQASFTFEAGKSYAITGPSGSGKSTLLKMIGLLLKPSAGERWIEGEKVSELSSREQAYLRNQYLGSVDQHYLLIDEQTVYQNIEVPLIYERPYVRRRERRKRIERILYRLDILDKMKEKVHNLSGGQKQRVAIARALINDASVVLADEPTGALDSQTGQELMTLLLSIVEDGKTLILVTHNMGLASQCDCILYMKDGELFTEHASG